MTMRGPEVAACANPVGLQPTPYYSFIHAGTTRSGGGPFTYAIASDTEYVAFSFGVGDAMTLAWKGDGTVGTATEAETNLVKANLTNDGDLVEIHGIGIEVIPNSSGELVREIFSKSHVKLRFGNGRERILGRPSFHPAGAGLGGSMPRTLSGNALDGAMDQQGFAGNGLGHVENFLKFPEPLIWNPTGQDTQLRVTLKLNRAISLDAATVAAAAGIRGFTAPAAGALGTYAEFGIRLFSKVVGKS